jgi:excisionase family DNA binding protein
MTELVGLPEAANRLGLHYMTVYRHVRTGRLPAIRRGGQWLVDVADLAPSTPSKRAGREPTPRRLARRMAAGDEPGSWMVVEEALASGASPTDVHGELLVPALRFVGDQWEAGRWSVADEHRATAVAQRLLGRLGPRFARPGRTRGTVVIGAPAGEQHALPCALLADLVRAAGFDAVDLGANTPAESFESTARGSDGLVAVLVGVTTSGLEAAVRRTVGALRATGVPVLVGGAAVRDDRHARSLGADGWTGRTAADALETVESLVARGPAPPARTTDGRTARRRGRGS